MKTKPSSLLMALERRRTLPDALLETDIITGLRTGELPSPTRLGNSLYFRMRMTGTGPVWRAQSGNTYRDPAQYINREFVSACVGIPLVMDHPASGRIGPDDKIVGTTVAAYTYQAPESPPEVWVISRVLDGGAQETLLNEVMSTSPSVIVGDSPDGFSEGAPIVLDHLALVKQGVWDLGGPPEGIDQEQIFNDSHDEVSQMTKDEMRELIRATVAESLAGKVLADSSPEDFSAKVDALVSQKLDSALAAHNPAAQADTATDLNPPMVAPQAVCADEAPEVVPDSEEKPAETLPDAEDRVAEPKENTVADAEETEAEVKADSENESKDEPKAETKADADEASDVVADQDPTDEEDEMVQNSEIAALKSQVETLTKALAGQSTLSDSEAAEMGAARLHADAAMQSVGKPAMQPFPGEKPLAYRKRVLNDLKSHSADLKSADFSAIADSATLALVEKQVFADAAAFARSGAGIPKNQMRARKHTTDAGHTVVEYDGSPRTWLQETEIPAFRAGRI